MDQQVLFQVLDYDENTGRFTHKVGSKKVKPGAFAGSVRSDGYITIKVRGKSYLAHRLAWLYVYGALPELLLDHVNEDRSDNRIGNLREATYSQNYQNMTRPHKDSRSGYLGVSWHIAGKKWAAEICVNRKRVKLGLFACPAEAHAAYLRAKAELHPFAPKDKI